MPKKISISRDERRELRRYRQSRKHLTQNALIVWFHDRFGRRINQSTVSDSLSDKYKYLDDITSGSGDLSRRRERKPQWEDLDRALLAWVEASQSSVIITDEVLKEKARRFFPAIPKYAGMSIPAFSNGWIGGFKKRHSIKSRYRHGEAGSVDIAAAQEQLVEIRAAVMRYKLADIYNCDETGLFWRSTPDRGMSTQPLPGIKGSKSRVTVHFCVNADGSDKLQPWFIGRARVPASFGARNINPLTLGIHWRHNQKAWMNTVLMMEWLRWFDRRCQGRKVLLLMDNFSAHTAAVTAIRDSDTPLQNTTVAYLPPNMTSKVQPLDQGIIMAFKSHYRKQWLQYMVDEFDKGLDPVRTLTILKAIRFCKKAWDEVSARSVENCWHRSTLLEVVTTQEVVDTSVNEVNILISTLQQQQRISEIMSVSNWLNPVDERVADTEEDIESRILADLTSQYQGSEMQEEDDDEGNQGEIVPPMPLGRAIDLLNNIITFAESQSVDNERDLKIAEELRGIHQIWVRQRQQSLRQGNITDFWAFQGSG